jgi:DMSO/TMAO reductase YedYZ molybdopterin-dependent catalytic subunit
MSITRRSIVEWLGKGAVIALGAPILKACGAQDSSNPLPDAGIGDYSFPFQPGSDGSAIFSKWIENTVDEHDLAGILASWTLTVDGLVATPRSYRFGELTALPRRDQLTDFTCVEGWTVYDVPWNGVPLGALIAAVAPSPRAQYVTFHTIADQYNESVPLAVAREPNSLMAYGVGGATLPTSHGFPLRVVIPRLLGYKNAKYVYRIELTDQRVDGYWEKFGYSYDAEVPRDHLRPGHY